MRWCGDTQRGGEIYVAFSEYISCSASVFKCLTQIYNGLRVFEWEMLCYYGIQAFLCRLHTFSSAFEVNTLLHSYSACIENLCLGDIILSLSAAKKRKYFSKNCSAYVKNVCECESKVSSLQSMVKYYAVENMGFFWPHMKHVKMLMIRLWKTI
jgi:hypothetical protein